MVTSAEQQQLNTGPNVNVPQLDDPPVPIENATLITPTVTGGTIAGATITGGTMADVQDDVDTLQTDMVDAQSDIETLQTVSDQWYGPFTVAHGDLTSAVDGEAQTITLFTATDSGAGAVSDAILLVATPFSGGSPVSVDGTVGNVDGVNTILGGTPIDMKTAGLTQMLQSDGDPVSILGNPGSIYTFTATPDGAHNLAALNAGSLTIWIKLGILPS